MKKIVAVLAFVTAACFSSAAQYRQPETTPEKPTFARKFGYKAGVNLVSFSKLAYEDPYLGFHAGLFGESRVTEVLGYGAEFNYSRQGLTYFDRTVNMNYLTVPVLLNIYGGPVTFQAGMYFSYLFYAGMENKPGGEQVTDHFKNTDYGFTVGLRCKPGGDFLFGARLNVGLMNVNSDLYLTLPETPLSVPKEDFKTLNAQIYFGHMF